jgi:hypothetical protein
VFGKLFLLSAFLFESEKKPFPGRIVVLDFQIHDSKECRAGRDRGGQSAWMPRSRPKAVEPHRRRMPASCLRSAKISRARVFALRIGETKFVLCGLGLRHDRCALSYHLVSSESSGYNHRDELSERIASIFSMTRLRCSPMVRNRNS